MFLLLKRFGFHILSLCPGFLERLKSQFLSYLFRPLLATQAAIFFFCQVPVVKEVQFPFLFPMFCHVKLAQFPSTSPISRHFRQPRIDCSFLSLLSSFNDSGPIFFFSYVTLVKDDEVTSFASVPFRSHLLSAYTDMLKRLISNLRSIFIFGHIPLFKEVLVPTPFLMSRHFKEAQVTIFFFQHVLRFKAVQGLSLFPMFRHVIQARVPSILPCSFILEGLKSHLLSPLFRLLAVTQALS
ncbi:unnamed protein product [Acanthosepion pharaonis]|uniref:Uncharacterized protein n=1 Tax=Acanthosepion pharaonis TaxID=158019 RepID=A0A812CJB9_ACAPH|nr:unnamed protein product [Sepia pharaonis]